MPAVKRDTTADEMMGKCMEDKVEIEIQVSMLLARR